MGGRPLRIAWLTVHQAGHEFEAIERGDVPTHRVLGATELADRGHDVRRCGAERRPRWLPYGVWWRLAQLGWLVRRAGETDVVVAMHEAAALPALLLKRLGLLRLPLVVMTVAATDEEHRARFVRWALRVGLPAADVVTVFASSQVALLGSRVPRLVGRIRFLPLGVDTTFFVPQGRERTGGVVAVGTNEGKDYATLVRALPADLPCDIVTDPANRAQAEPWVEGKQVAFGSAVPIRGLRDLYAGAGLVVLPLREVPYSTGQTVLLESLAMAAPVVVTDVAAVADYVEGADGALTLVPVADVEAMTRALVLETRDVPAAREHVLAHFTIDRMAADLESILREVIDGRARMPRA